ncbi:6-phosphogluconate dehydrogenase [Thermoascus aurantiacus ATCC 26904]
MRPVSVGILSIGDMGLGIAKLLQAHGYRVLTVGLGRSEDTLARIRSASIEDLPSDQNLVIQSDYILSIVPPRDALATARRISTACQLPDTMARRAEVPDHEGLGTRPKPCYIDLNAIPARLAREIASTFSPASTSPSNDDGTVLCQFLDGGIIGAPPSQDSQSKSWQKPSLVTLNMKIISATVGSASTLKLSFAALTKGLTALAILSFATAEKEEILPELLEHLEEYSPHTAALCTRGVTGMPPKAYRWVEEMRGIGEAFDAEGSWRGLGESVFGAFAEVYRTVAEETVLGQEKVGKRRRGTTVADVAQIMARNRVEQGE